MIYIVLLYFDDYEKDHRRQTIMIYGERLKHLIGILDPFGISILVMRFAETIMEDAELIVAHEYELSTTCYMTHAMETAEVIRK